MKYLFAILVILSIFGCQESTIPVGADFSYKPAPTGPPVNFNFYWDSESGSGWGGYVAIGATCLANEITVVTGGVVYQFAVESGNIFNAGDILEGTTSGQVFTVTKNGAPTNLTIDIGTTPGESAVIGVHIVYMTP
jgi:hypothetical protein